MCVPRIGIAGSYGDSVFNILRSCQTAFQSGCIILQSHRQFLKILVYLYSCQHLLSFVLFSMAPGPGEEFFLDPQLTYLGVLDSSVLGFRGVIKLRKVTDFCYLCCFVFSPRTSCCRAVGRS